MAKRRHAVGKNKKSHSKKTKKRLEAKKVMLDAKAKGRKGKK
jgi:ribosomal protein L32